MMALKKYLPSFASALLMCTVLFIIYPHYQYYIDPDGTAYLTISQRYANGDTFTAINGYWSPWACWLTAILIKQGIAPIPSSVIINTLGAIGFLFISQSFFLRFNIISKLQWLLNTTLALFLCFAIFWQSFDDLWECFFLLAALRIMLADDFVKKPALWFLCGFIGTLAYFAKAYSFPFFILNTICCTYFLSKDNKQQWLKISFATISVMILFSLPWIVALHNKYHIWTTSTSGSLNMSWYLVGHPYWKGGIKYLIPPFYKGSPSYWEDPYWANGRTPHFWDSWQLFGLQILRIGLNCWKLLRSMLEISVFFPVVSIIALLSLRSKKIAAHFTGDIKLVILSFLLFPLGYMLVNFESRYIWYMLPLGMVIGGVIIQNKWKSIFFVIASATFLIYPAYGLMKMYGVGWNEYMLAKDLKRLEIHGSFTCITNSRVELQQYQRLAYFSDNQFYGVPGQNVSYKDIIEDMQRFNVNYIFYLGESSIDQVFQKDSLSFRNITNTSMYGLTVYKLD